MSASPASSISGHILGLPAAAWGMRKELLHGIHSPDILGHQKPMVALACKCVQERPDILVTILVLGPHRIVERMENEIRRYLPEEKLKSNIRCSRLRIIMTFAIDIGGVGLST